MRQKNAPKHCAKTKIETKRITLTPQEGKAGLTQTLPKSKKKLRQKRCQKIAPKKKSKRNATKRNHPESKHSYSYTVHGTKRTFSASSSAASLKRCTMTLAAVRVLTLRVTMGAVTVSFEIVSSTASICRRQKNSDSDSYSHSK